MERTLCAAAVLFVVAATLSHAAPKGGVIRAPRVADRDITVDGRLVEWRTNLATEQQRITLTRDTGFVHVGTVDNDKDFRAIVYAVHDSSALYVAAEVTDDATEKGFAGGENWRNDCIEIWIDGANDGGTMPDRGGNDPDNYQLNVDVNGKPYVYRNNDAAKLLAQIASAATVQGTNYTLEVRIPFAAIPEAQTKAESVLGFGVSFVDSDKGAWNHILWQGDVENDPNQWGDLVFASETLAVRPRGKAPAVWAALKGADGRQRRSAR
jgi:hypothetical protein